MLTLKVRSSAIALALCTSVACFNSGSKPSPEEASIVVPPSAPCLNAASLPQEVHGQSIDSARFNFLVSNGYCQFFVPEFHDEQRLTDGTGQADYGGIAYSYAHPIDTLGPLRTHLGYDNRWINAAVVHVVGPVFGPYNALHLVTGKNCVYLRHLHHGASANWQARIMPPANSGLCTGGSSPILNVADEQPSPHPRDYPSVTRWMERMGRFPLLGVGCGDFWCIIGPGGAALASSHTGHPGAGTSTRWTIRGWHDDQTLGIPRTLAEPASRFGLYHKGPKISIVPDDNLGSRNEADFLTGSDAIWIPVATVFVPEGTDLKAKYGSRPGFGFREGRNEVSIRAYGPYPYTWKARLINSSCAAPAGCVYAKNVKWEDHKQHTSFVPATARWRWFDQDEEMWVRCSLGCCMVQPD